MNFLLEALIKKLEGEIEMAKANIKVYEKNPAGIGEHPDVVTECKKLVQEIAEARELREVINSITVEDQDNNNQNK